MAGAGWGHLSATCAHGWGWMLGPAQDLLPKKGCWWVTLLPKSVVPRVGAALNCAGSTEHCGAVPSLHGLGTFCGALTLAGVSSPCTYEHTGRFQKI